MLFIHLLRNKVILQNNISHEKFLFPCNRWLSRDEQDSKIELELDIQKNEITGGTGRIERVYFENKETNLEQWTKPQIKDSKRQFLFDIVNEGDAKEKLEHFVNFCEDTIFEMQLKCTRNL